MGKDIGLQEVRSLVFRAEGPHPNREDRERARVEMQSLGAERLFPHLKEILKDPDREIRCQACVAIYRIDPKAGIELLLPMLDDPEVVVRWVICGLLHEIADKRAVEPLIRIMKTDPDPQARNTAAYALGGLGDPAAIPDLIETLENDHEVDELGHTASWSAAMALDDIVRTNHTRIKSPNGLCTLSPIKPDLDLLKSQAMEVYRGRQPS